MEYKKRMVDDLNEGGWAYFEEDDRAGLGEDALEIRPRPEPLTVLSATLLENGEIVIRLDGGKEERIPASDDLFFFPDNAHYASAVENDLPLELPDDSWSVGAEDGSYAATFMNERRRAENVAAYEEELRIRTRERKRMILSAFNLTDTSVTITDLGTARMNVLLPNRQTLEVGFVCFNGERDRLCYDEEEAARALAAEAC